MNDSRSALAHNSWYLLDRQDNLIFYLCRRQEAATIFHSALVEIANLAQSRDAPFPFCLRNCDVWHHSLNALSESALSCSWWKGQQRCRADLSYSHSTPNPMRRAIFQGQRRHPCDVAKRAMSASAVKRWMIFSVAVNTGGPAQRLHGRHFPIQESKQEISIIQ